MTGPQITFDSFRLARRRETLRGEVSVAELPRLQQSVVDPRARIAYLIEGRIDDRGHPGALMTLSGRLTLRCERCNAPLEFELDRRVPFRFLPSEEELNALPVEDDELEEVVGSASMALLPWIEDEAILSLPLVPRHDDCPLPLNDLASGAALPERTHPFAALARLKQRGGDGSTEA